MSATLAIVPIEEVRAIEQQTTLVGKAALARAEAIAISSEDDAERAAQLNNEIGRLDADAEKQFKPAKQAQDAAKKAILDAEHASRDAFARAIRIIKVKLADWHNFQETKRLKEEAEARTVARKQEEDRRLAEANVAEAAGDSREKVQEILAAPITVAAPVVPTAQKLSGTSFREKWVGVVVDKFRAICFIAMHPEYVNLLIFDQGSLDKTVSAQKEAFSIPGIRVEKQTVVVGSRR